MRRGLLPVLAVAFTFPLLAQQQQQPPQPRPPVFRAGAHYVRVDAYPIDKRGRIREGLTKDDFEVYEDGKLQTIDRAEFITFDTWTPEAERKDPRTQQDAYDLAADPAYRVFVIVIDPDAYGMEGRHYLRTPLHEFIERNLGPRDLFGLLTTRNEWTDLVLGQTTTAANATIDSREWLDPERIDERFWPYYECGLSHLVGAKKLDDTFNLLAGLVRLLGLIRQERKGIIFVSNGLWATRGSRGSGSSNLLPRIPRIGAEGGRVGGVGGVGPRDRIGGRSLASSCDAERMRLSNIDFRERHRELLKSARQGNVAFYPVSPLGLPTIPFKERGGIDLDAYHRITTSADSLLTLADETDGIAIVNTNDLSGGLRRIANDMQAYYVLGYYTSNTKWDGGVRSIKVRLKPKRDTIRARKQYRAPTMEEVVALSAPASTRVPTAEETALAALVRARPDLPFTSYAAHAGASMSVVLEIPQTASPWPAGTEIAVLAEAPDGDVIGSSRSLLNATTRTAVVTVPLETGHSPGFANVRVRSDGMVFADRVPLAAPSSLVGDAVAFRNGTPAAVLSCARTDGVRLEWTILKALDRRQVRLLDRNGKPLSLPIHLTDNETALPDRVVLDLSLAPLVRGDYLIELTAGAGTVSARKLHPLRIR